MALRKTTWLLIATGLFLSSHSAFAANPLAATSTEQRRFEEQDKRAEVRRRLEKEEKKPSIEVKEAPVAKTGEREVSFYIEKINVTGVTALPMSAIREIVAPYEKRDIKLSEAKAAAEKITDLYRQMGYITCRAYIPPQKIETKELEIKILEGKLGKINVQGNHFFSKEVITRSIGKLKDKIIEYRRLEKELFNINIHPDRQVKAVILPGDVMGTSDLLLDVKDDFPLHIGGEINNYGTKSTGLERYAASVRHSNLLGYDDIFSARAQFGDEVFAVGSQYTIPVGDYGTELGAGFDYTDVSVGREFKVLDIRGTAYRYKIFVNQPLYDTRYLSFVWTGAFEYKSINNTVLDTPSSRDDLRMFRTGINADEVDPWGRSYVVNEFTFGVPYFGASAKNSPRISRMGAGATFFKYNGVINRIQPIYDSTNLYLKGSAQFTSNRLLPAEQVDIGGIYSVRGYPQSDYLGDYGVGGSAELRVPSYFIPKTIKVPGTDIPIWNRINFVAFLDCAYAKLRNAFPGEHPSRNYMGAGGGIRVDLPRNLIARFEWAAPLGDEPSDKSKSQFYFSISGELP